MRTLPDIENLLQPLERAISDVLIPSLIGRNCSEAERDLVALPVRMGGLGLINPSDSADAEYSASIRVSAPLVIKIEAQYHEIPEEAEVQRLEYATRKENDDGLGEELEEVKATLPDKTPGGGGVLPYKGLMGTCGHPGYVFRVFCLKQGIEFINFCLN